MSAPKQKARDRILEAAVASFQSLGYARTTTQAIAQNAGVAEVTLFRHFGDKQQLFQTAVQQIGGGPNFELLEAQLTYELEADLTLMCQHTLHFFLAQQDAIRMLLFESAHFPEMTAALAQNPRGMIALLDRYFQVQIAAGNLQAINPEATAQAFMSMVLGYAIGMVPIKGLLPVDIADDDMVTEFVRIFLAALSPLKS